MAVWWASGSSFPCPNPHPNSSQVGELVDVSPSLPYPNSSQVGELVDVSPDVWLHLSAGATGARGVEMLLPAPLSFGDEMHNSIHPLWIPEFGAYLCVGHQHIRSGYVRRTETSATSATGSKQRFDAPARYGYSYRHTFFLMQRPDRLFGNMSTTPTKWRMTRHSRELCFTSVEQRPDGTSPGCEIIQFAMTAFRIVRPDGAAPLVGLSYGIMDCEAALLAITLERLDSMLEFNT